MKKGQLVYTEGKLQTRNWEDKDGIKRYTTEVVCDMFTMLGRKMENDGPQAAEPASSGDEEDDLPF